LGRDPAEFAAAAAPYVCVRVTDMSQVDVRAIRFDFDLTFVALVMNADGTVYHRYGGRGPNNALEYLSLGSLARLLRDTMADHATYEAQPAPPAAPVPLPAIGLPSLRAKLAQGQRIDCVHCHMVNDAEHAWAVQEKCWQRDDLYVHPDPARIGLQLDCERQEVVHAVAADSPAAKAGLRQGDVLLQLGVQRSVRSFSDVQWALHQAPSGDHTLPVRYRRGEQEHGATLALAAGWKRCLPEEYAWRSYKWNLSPQAGFGGPALGAAEKAKLGLPADKFAFRVAYLVDWGERAHRGRAAAKAGLQKGDVLLAFAGKDDFASVDHFHAFVALTLPAGTDIEIVVLRAGQRQVLHYALPE